MPLGMTIAVASPDTPSGWARGTGLLRCPTCHGALGVQAAQLGCGRCQKTWPVEDGAVQFGGRDPRRHGLSYAQRQAVTAVAAAEGWPAALHDHLRALAPSLYRQAVDENRALWRFVLPLAPTSQVLELNCGWGAVTFNLAESCGSVVAADACPAHARFVALRAEQSDHANVTALQLALDQPFPVARGAFDAVVLVDGLRWLRDSEAQRRVLAEIRRVLRPGGRLLLGEANLVSLTRLTQPCQGVLHTLRGYQHLLRSVGFRHLELYAPAPSHLEPFFILPLAESPPLVYFMREITARQNFEAHFQRRGQAALYHLAQTLVNLTPAALLRFGIPFLPSFALVARM